MIYIVNSVISIVIAITISLRAWANADPRALKKSG